MGCALADGRNTALPAETDELADLRRRIDAVDRAILARLNERAGLVVEVGRVKQDNAASIYEASRELAIVADLCAANEGPFPDTGLAPVFREIISATRSLEAVLRVAYFGPEGTFTHLAARRQFGDLADLVSEPSIPGVIDALEKGKAALGVVPIENTTEGIVTATYDCFATCGPDIRICGEAVQRISNHLMSLSGKLGDVKRVVSHPQPLAQCRGWLDRNLPDVERIEAASTAAAARLAKQDGDVAAIGSEMAASVYGLETIEASIEDRNDNTTRFVMLGRQDSAASGDDLTSAMFTIRKDESGGLHRLLEPFARFEINLTSIQLRPIAGKPWEYTFFLDFEGHATQEHVAEALRAVADLSHSHQVLGSYPRAARSSGAAAGSRG